MGKRYTMQTVTIKKLGVAILIANKMNFKMSAIPDLGRFYPYEGEGEPWNSSKYIEILDLYLS